jgi:hypothetical protein
MRYHASTLYSILVIICARNDLLPIWYCECTAALLISSIISRGTTGSTPAAAFLYPIQFRLGQFPAGISGIQGSRRFDQQDFTLFFGTGFVLHTLRDDRHFTGIQVQAFIAQVDSVIALDDHEDFIGFRVAVPDKVAIRANKFEMGVVHRRDDFVIKPVMEFGKLFLKIDNVDGHGVFPFQ